MSHLALPVEIIYTASCSIIDLTVLFLDLIIINVIHKDRQLRRQPSVIYIANLALVDLFLAGVNFTNILFHFFQIDRIFPLCVLVHGYLPFCLMSASLLFMFTNSVDRFIFIRMSLKYHYIMNPKIAKRVALVIWSYSLTFPLLPFVIFDQFWEYNTCGDIIFSKSYRYGHGPIQVIFFVTILFTALMFVSVFRVVKNSRRLRHIPTRSSSVESLSTMASSMMTLSVSSPTLPPISELVPCELENSENSPITELVPYEHENSEVSSAERFAVFERLRNDSSNSYETDISYPDSESNTASFVSEEGGRICEPTSSKVITNHDSSWETTNIQKYPDDGIPDLHESPISKRNTMKDMNSFDSHSKMNNKREVVFSRVCEDCRNKRLSISSPWTFSVKPPTDTGESDSDNIFISTADQNNVAVSGDIFHNKENYDHSSDAESSEINGQLNSTQPAESVFGIYLSESHSENPTSDVSAVEEALEKNNFNLDTRNLTEKYGEQKLNMPNKVTKLDNDFTKDHNHCKRRPCKTKLSPPIPAESLTMVNFKLQTWDRNDVNEGGDNHENETSFSSRHDNLNESDNGALPSISGHHDCGSHYRLITPHGKVFHFDTMPFLTMYKSSLAATVNTSLVCIGDASSFRNVSTDPAMMNENASVCEQNSDDAEMDELRAEITEGAVKFTDGRRQKVLNRSLSRHSRRRVNPAQENPHPRVFDALHENSKSPSHPRRPNTLHLLNRSVSNAPNSPHRSNRHLLDRSVSNTSDSPYRPKKQYSLNGSVSNTSDSPYQSKKQHSLNRSVSETSDSPGLMRKSKPPRTYVRNISTTTTASTSSIPFGNSSYSGRDIRTLKILFLMFCVYIILWLPSFIIQMLRYSIVDVSWDVAVIGYTIGVANSVFNFFVYPMRIPRLRISFKQLFTAALTDFKKNVRAFFTREFFVSLFRRHFYFGKNAQ